MREKVIKSIIFWSLVLPRKYSLGNVDGIDIQLMKGYAAFGGFHGSDKEIYQRRNSRCVLVLYLRRRNKGSRNTHVLRQDYERVINSHCNKHIYVDLK